MSEETKAPTASDVVCERDRVPCAPVTGSEPSRAEHLAWCKRRALEYCDMGDVNQAFASMASDLGKHPKTANHAAIELGMMLLLSGHLSSPNEMRRFIEGFN